LRTEASWALEAIGDASIIPVARALAKADSADWNSAIGLLADFGPRAKSAVPGLKRLFAERVGKDRIDLAYVLVKIDGNQDSLTALIEGSRAKDGEIRELAEFRLRSIDEEWARVPALIEALKDDHLFVRLYAAEALGRIGAKAKAAIPPLTEAAMQSTGVLQEAAQTALSRIKDAANSAPLR
jgi:HEAT repeat protein